MKYGCLKVLMFCSFNIFLKSPVAAQEMSVEAYAADCIRLLHEGDLIIQLKSEEKNYRHYRVNYSKEATLTAKRF